MSYIYMYIQVRDETNKVQFGRMDMEQQEEMTEETDQDSSGLANDS